MLEFLLSDEASRSMFATSASVTSSTSVPCSAGCSSTVASNPMSLMSSAISSGVAYTNTCLRKISLTTASMLTRSGLCVTTARNSSTDTLHDITPGCWERAFSIAAAHDAQVMPSTWKYDVTVRIKLMICQVT